MVSKNGPIDELCINTIRFLSIDAIQKANSGHPGTPMGAAAMVYVLWDRFLRHNPKNPRWLNRDRFVLSAGHASMLLYSLLYLTGYDLSLEDLKNFRQWGSKTPGHPEYGLTPGVETTTGPLGQGFGNAVGMAIAERWLAKNFNKPGYELIKHLTYALVSDGDIQEGISSEAASLAGTLRLGNLICLYDDNDISIEGNTSIACAENVGQRFSSYGWHVIGPVNGMNASSIDKAIRTSQQITDRPSLIICHTVIGYGSPNKAGTASAHGEPLGEQEISLVKKQLNWNYVEPFSVPPEAINHMRLAIERGRNAQQQWDAKFETYCQVFPDEARQLLRDINGELPDGWSNELDIQYDGETKPIATREASGRIINNIANRIHSFMGGSADLAPSTKTIIKDHADFGVDEYSGRNMHFGVREHAMGAISNGMALHGGLIPYTATFLVFYDYMRPPVRLAALMGIRVIFLFTHDSIGVGEDGPTHQPIEQLVGLRSVPNLVTIRPADATETFEAWKIAIERKNGPTALVLTRQNVPILDRNKMAPASGLSKGGYVLWESSDQPKLVIISSGSEVHIALEAGNILKEKGFPIRVVSMPSWELFDTQPEEYRNKVLPPQLTKRVSIEAGSPLGWDKYVGREGKIIGISHFGASAPGKILFEKMGLTAENVVKEALKLF